MRILHLDSGREMRGGQWQVLYLLRGLRALGHEIALLARRNGPLLAAAAAEGLDAGPLTMTAYASRLAQGPDIVHAHDARTHTLAALTAVRSVISRRVGFEIRDNPLSRWKYAGADHYIAISDFVARQLIAAGIKSSAISVVPDGVPPVAENGFSPDGRIVAPRTADPMKGADLLEQAARLAGVEAFVTSDLPRDLPGARMFVYISRQEGLGSAVLLAMAHGVPVVASRVGGIPEAVDNGRSGILVENDPEDIALGIRTLLADPGLAARMGEQGRQLAQKFSIGGMVDGTVSVYEKVLKNA